MSRLRTGPAAKRPLDEQVQSALTWLKSHSTSLTVHDKRAGDAAFIRGLALIEREAGDDRNFVRKATNMALRAIGKRNRALNAAAMVVARRLAKSTDVTARWVGKDALRELTSPALLARLKPSAVQPVAGRTDGGDDEGPASPVLGARPAAESRVGRLRPALRVAGMVEPVTPQNRRHRRPVPAAGR